MKARKALASSIKNLLHSNVSKLALIDGDTSISSKAKINRFCKLRRSSIDKYSYIGPNSNIHNTDIARYCSISWDCDIGLENHLHSRVSTSPIFTEVHNGTGSVWISGHQPLSEVRTKIGNDVWIGARTMVIGGIEIGDGAVIGAGSIVTRDIPSYAIAVGAPAKVFKYRFSQEVIKELLEIKWWNFPEDFLKKNISIFQDTSFSIQDLISIKKLLPR